MAKVSFSKNLIAIIIGLAMAIAIVEIFGRVAPIDTGFRAGMSYLRFNPAMGFELDPELGSFAYEKACIDIDKVTLNEQGNRIVQDNPAALDDAGMRIAVLGDSFMVAREVGDNEHFSVFLQKFVLGAQVDNYGVPGYGTIQQYLSFREKAKATNPQITVLAFLDANDVADNSAALTQTEKLSAVRPFFSADGAELLPLDASRWAAIFPVTMAANVHRTLKYNLYSYHVLLEFVVKPSIQLLQSKPSNTQTAPTKAASHAAKAAANTDANTDGNAKAAMQGQRQKRTEYWWQRNHLFPHIAVYQSEPDEVWNRAWGDTELALQRLNAEVESQGGHLVVMLIPPISAAWVDSTLALYEAEFGEPEPPNFDLSYPARRLQQFGAANGIDILDLNIAFSSYLARHEFDDPKFYFRCDGHWNPLAHYLAAQSLVKHLRDGGVIDASALSLDAEYLDRSPQELLGDDGIAAIYGWGEKYTGGSAIGQMQ